MWPAKGWRNSLPTTPGRVQGSIPRGDVARFGAYTFRTKSEVWAHNLTKLYEEFITRQWSSATDIPWETIQPLPDDIEAAQCQLATFFTQVEFIASDVPGRFISTMSPDYQEVRLALLAQVMDESRHLDVFRKRALANGGGLMRMIDSVSDVVGGSTDNAREFTEFFFPPPHHRRGQRADPVPAGRDDGIQRGRKSYLPPLRPGRGPPCGHRSVAPAVHERVFAGTPR